MKIKDNEKVNEIKDNGNINVKDGRGKGVDTCIEFQKNVSISISARLENSDPLKIFT